MWQDSIAADIEQKEMVLKSLENELEGLRGARYWDLKKRTNELKREIKSLKSAQKQMRGDWS